eukprot:TRINITY_DN56145_c0_g1_i1.p1 TRINITY_DN56145_c0_g1~~TRINITY_DN56145_c0_g1_i1.p1  ORF type:complete len:461 (-),score=40.19 TRINITY_DN56145_c0_g1_i1:276-1658(-)
MSCYTPPSKTDALTDFAEGCSVPDNFDWQSQTEWAPHSFAHQNQWQETWLGSCSSYNGTSVESGLSDLANDGQNPLIWMYVPLAMTDADVHLSQAWVGGSCEVHPFLDGQTCQVSRTHHPSASTRTSDADADCYDQTSRVGSISATAWRRRRRQRAAAYARRRRDDGREQDARSGPTIDTREFALHAGTVAEKIEWHDRIEALIEIGGEAEHTALSELTGSAKHLAFGARGCRTLQLVLRKGNTREVSGLVAELHGSVRHAITSPYANHVIQTVVEVMPIALAAFVPEELKGVGAETSCHKYGCRIMCRLLEHCANTPATTFLTEETLSEAGKLCRHTFGHYVMESVLEHGGCALQTRVVAALLAELLENAVNNSATHVIAAALRHVGDVDRARLACSLLDLPGGLPRLAEDRYGIHVARALLRLTGEHGRMAQKQLQQNVALLKNSQYGRRIVEEFFIS